MRHRFSHITDRITKITVFAYDMGDKKIKKNTFASGNSNLLNGIYISTAGERPMNYF